MRLCTTAVFVALLALAAAQDYSKSFYFENVGNGQWAKSELQVPQDSNGIYQISNIIGAPKDFTLCAQPNDYDVQPPYASNCGGAFFDYTNKSAKAVLRDVQATRRSFSAYASNKQRLSSRFVGSTRFALEEAADATGVLNLVPGVLYTLWAYSDSTTATNVFVNTTSQQCAEGVTNGACQPADALTDGQGALATIVKSASKLYKYSVPNMPNPLVYGYVNFTLTPSTDSKKASFTFYVRAGTPPDVATGGFFTPPSNQIYMEFGKNKAKSTQFQIPLSISAGDWYILVVNSNSKESLTITTTANYTGCAANMFGDNCAYDMTKDIIQQDISNHTIGVVANPKQWTYIQINNLASLPVTAQIFRVSVVSERGTHSQPVFAAQTVIPTYSAYYANASSNYVNQMLLPAGGAANVGAAGTWYIAVYKNNDNGFKFWVGLNCQNCTANDSKGKCKCAGAADGVCTADSVYALPTNASDSYGRCSCSKDKLDFICDKKISKTNKSPPTIWIVMIAVGMAIVLAVAIGVPVYCYLQNRKRNNYERV